MHSCAQLRIIYNYNPYIVQKVEKRYKKGRKEVKNVEKR